MILNARECLQFLRVSAEQNETIIKLKQRRPSATHTIQQTVKKFQHLFIIASLKQKYNASLSKAPPSDLTEQCMYEYLHKVKVARRQCAITETMLNPEELHGVSFDSIAGHEDAKKLLKEAVLLPALYPQLFHSITVLTITLISRWTATLEANSSFWPSRNWLVAIMHK